MALKTLSMSSESAFHRALHIEEIERAIDHAKGGVASNGKRTASDKWFRRMWYINQWRNRHRNRQGARITRD